MTGRQMKLRGGRHRLRRSTETSSYVAMLERMIYAYGQRIADDPAALVHFRELEQAMRNAVNLGIHGANKIADSNGSRYSINEMAAILGVSKQAIHVRVGQGADVHAMLEAARAGGALVRLADVRGRRALALEAAGVPDKTGSAKELAAGA
jgi:hypothetical protein